MDLASFIIASVACITVICYLAATAVKQTPLANKWSIFSDQSPRDEHERLREVRVRPEGNGAPSGTLPRSKNAPLGRFCPPDRRRARAVLVTRWCTRLNLL